MSHQCHALGCNNRCAPKYLMCAPCWALVPSEMRQRVNMTVLLRGPVVDKTWAPWWRAQALAIAHVAMIRDPRPDRCREYINKAMAFADTLEKR